MRRQGVKKEINNEKRQEADSFERSFALERLVFFSDAVFAIVITLLAIELRVPDLNVESSDALLNGVFAMWPKFLAFGMSFWIVAIYWLAHHRYFRYIIQYNTGLLWLNLLMLFSISFVPFTMSVLGEYGNLRSANWLYTLNMLLIGLSSALFWYHAIRTHLVLPNLSKRYQRVILYRAFATPLAAIIVFILTFVLDSYASLGFFLIFLFQWLIERIYHERLDSV